MSFRQNGIRPTSVYTKDDIHYALCIFNRASYARCRGLIKALCKHPHIKLDILLSSSLLWKEFGSAVDYIKDEFRKPNVTLIDISNEPLHQENEHLGMCQVSAELLLKFSAHFAANKYNAVIVIADRFETLPAAMAAAYLHIPLVHLQGGEITGNIDDKIRNAVTRLADYHLCSTDLSKKYLITSGEERDRVHCTGCPSMDIIRENEIERKHDKRRFIICMFHPLTTDPIATTLLQTEIVYNCVMDYCVKYSATCDWYWPNPDAGRGKLVQYLEPLLSGNDFIKKVVNKPPLDFLRDLAVCKFIVGNSSCAIREAGYLGTPAINIGMRQSIRERSINVLDLPNLSSHELFEAMQRCHTVGRYNRSRLYGTGLAGQYMATLLSSWKPSLKTHLTLPFDERFFDQHFGEDRIAKHRWGKRIFDGSQSD